MKDSRARRLRTIATLTVAGLSRVFVLATVLLASGCATTTMPLHPRAARTEMPAPGTVALRPARAPVSRGATAVPVSPFSDAPVSFLVKGEFTRGELVIVRVCLRPDRSIASSSILESSGDRRFDELAVDWARLVRLRATSPHGAPEASCGAVRVELHNPSEPAVVQGDGNLLG